MSIWDEAELIEEPQPKKNIWDEAELIEEPQPITGVKKAPVKPQETPASKPIEAVESEKPSPLSPTTLAGGVKAFNFDNAEIKPVNEHPIREGLLQAGRGIARAILPKKAENWFIGNKEDEAFLNTYNESNVPTYEKLREYYDNGIISQDDFVKGTELRGKLDRLTADKEYREERNKNIGKGAVDIGSAVIPVGAGAKLTTKGISLLKPVLGRKGAEFVTRGALGGATAGAIHGTGYSLVDEEINPLKQILGDTLGWGAGGALGGAAIGAGNKVYRNIKAKNIRNARTEAQNLKAQPLAEDIQPVINAADNAQVIEPVQNQPSLKPLPSKELKPSKLKGTMKKAGTLPEQLENKPIEYEVLHNPQTIARAQEEIGADANAVHRDLLKKISGQGDYENYVLNADDVVKARELATKLYQEGNTNDAIELTEGIIKAASKTGQALQAYTLWARTTPQGAIAYAQKMLNRYNKSQHKNLKLSDEQAEKIKELAENVQKTAEGTRENEIAIGQMQKYIADLTPVSWSKKYDTYRYINMLLSPKSRTKDFILTGLNAADSAIDEIIANGIDKVRTLFPNQKKAFGGLKPAEWLTGLKKGFKEGAEDVSLNIDTSRSGEVGRYGLPKTRSFKHTPLAEIEKSPKGLLQLGENVLAGAEKGLNYTLQVPDRMFYEARFSSSLADQLAASGLKEPTQAMINQARKEALEAVYQDDSWVSRLGNATRNLVNEVPERIENSLNLPENVIPRIGNFIAPFVTTPANIVNIGLKNTFGAPVGIAKLARAKTPQEIRDAEMLIAKNIKGLAPLGLGTGIGLGKIKGNIGNDDYQADAVTGLRPQSIVIGDKAISLKDYPQWSIPASIGAGLAQGGIPQAAVNALEAVGDISALKAVGDTLDAFKPRYGQNPTPAEIANNLFRTQGVNILTQNLPFGGLLGEIRNDIDPYAREMYMPVGNTTPEMVSNSLKYAGNRIQNRLPFASRGLPLKYNAIGEPAKINNINNPIARVASEAIDLGIRNYNENPVYNELSDFQEQVKDSDYTGKTKVGLHTPSRSVRVNGENIKLDNKQYSDFSHDYTKINYILKGMAVNDETFKNMDDAGKVDYLSDLRKSAEEAVKIMQFGHTPTRKWHPYTQYILDNYIELVDD